MSSLEELLFLRLVARRNERRRRQAQVQEAEAEAEAPRRMWVQPMVSQRYSTGHFSTLYNDLRRDHAKFQAFTRFTIPTYDRLLEDLRPGLTFRNTNMRRCITPEERLLVTLRFLATGNTFASLHFEFLLGSSTIAAIVQATCKTIWSRLKRAVMPTPTKEKWLEIAAGFETSAQFPNCIGALDGKHIRVLKPPRSGSMDSNHNSYFSVVLLALADSDYHFVLVDIGSYGSTADARVFRASRMGQRLQSEQFSLPEPRTLPGSSGSPAPYVIVGDEGFGLTKNIMRPFARRDLNTRRKIFNHRLTRARRYVDYAFEILINKWQVIQSAIHLGPEKVTTIVQACVLLHNFSRIHDGGTVITEDLQPLPLCSDPEDIPPPGSVCTSGLRVRDQFTDYFMEPAGAVAWHTDMTPGQQ